MELKEVYENLCYYDKRNPDNQIDDIDAILGHPEPCYCDNCFHGVDKLAREIIKLKQTELSQKEINHIAYVYDHHIELLYFSDTMAYSLQGKFNELKKD